MSKAGSGLPVALEELKENPEQWQAVYSQQHCVVLAGPGSGKTKTLTVAMARALKEDVAPPRGIACLTYNKECVSELEQRMKKLGVPNGERCYIGTLHAFAFSYILLPYGRCFPWFKPNLRIAEAEEADHCKLAALKRSGYPIWNWRAKQAWGDAERHRRVCADRASPLWTSRQQSAQLAEEYERELENAGLIDFDQIILSALWMIREAPWIRRSLRSKFPVLFIDEYQDLGYALHEAVGLLCFQSGMRLFAVGDPDQSIYGFNSANPDLLKELASRPEVEKIHLKINYRSTPAILQVSQQALGEQREYQSKNALVRGRIHHHAINGDLTSQAGYVVDELIPDLVEMKIPREEIAILYKEARYGNELAQKLRNKKISFTRADKEAIVKRTCPLSKFFADCLLWATRGWTTAEPTFDSLRREALRISSCNPAETERAMAIEIDLMRFLRRRVTHKCLAAPFLRELKQMTLSWLAERPSLNSWKSLDQLVRIASMGDGGAYTMWELARRIRGIGMHPLSTFHSSKGREFQAVVLFNMNSDVLPSPKDLETPASLSECRRLFYVAVSRAKTELHLVYRRGQNSAWVEHLDGFGT